MGRAKRYRRRNKSVQPKPKQKIYLGFETLEFEELSSHQYHELAKHARLVKRNPLIQRQTTQPPDVTVFTDTSIALELSAFQFELLRPDLLRLQSQADYFVGGIDRGMMKSFCFIGSSIQYDKTG